VRSGHSGAAVLPLALQAVCTAAGLELAVLLLRDKTSASLHVRAHRGRELPAAINDVPIALAQNELLAKLLKREAAFHWLPENHKSLLSGLPLQLFGEKAGFLFSLVVADKPLGIILGCRPLTAPAQHAAAFRKFKQICIETRNALNHPPTGVPASV
jgi:hypothetical protein